MRFVYNLSLKNAARIIIQKRIHVGFMDLYNQSIKHGKDKKNNRENKTARFTSSRHRRAKTRRPGGLTHGLGKKKRQKRFALQPKTLSVPVSFQILFDPMPVGRSPTSLTSSTFFFVTHLFVLNHPTGLIHLYFIHPLLRYCNHCIRKKYINIILNNYIKFL